MNNNIAKVRKQHGLTQRELANKLNVTPAMVSQWENGHRTPGFESLKRIAVALDVSIFDLLSNDSRGLDSLFADQIPISFNSLDWDDVNRIEPIVVRFFLDRIGAKNVDTIPDNGATAFRLNDDDEVLTFLERQEVLKKLTNYFDALIREILIDHEHTRGE